MWSLLTSNASSLGRLLSVGLLPSSIVVVAAWLLIAADSFTGRSDWRGLLAGDLRSDSLSILLFVLAVILISAIVQPFQIRLVRMLEGYWDGLPFTRRLAPVFAEYQGRRLNALSKRLNELDVYLKRQRPERRTVADGLREDKRWSMAKAERLQLQEKLSRYPGQHLVEGRWDQVSLLPTALGNALRTAETSGGERYGLHTLYSWPRMHACFSERFAATYASVRNSVDALSNLCISFALVTLMTAAAFLDEPWLYWVPVGALVMSVLSYIGAVAAASDHITHVRAAYDLHRFDLVRAMGYERPKNAKDEAELFEALSTLFTQERLESRHHLLVAKVPGLAKKSYARAGEAEDDQGKSQVGG